MMVERAYAKINLTLDVLGRRSDGYHEVEMVMQTIDLSDVIWLEPLPGPEIELESNATNIPLDGRNLAVVAARAMQAHTGVMKGVRIRVEKHIPVAAGLGGGSADAAAVLRGLNRLWEINLPLEELADIGASIGSDVPFCVYGGCAIARGRGERIDRVEHALCAWVVLVRPQVFVSTADVYGALTPSDYRSEVRTAQLVAALKAADIEAVKSAVCNDLAPVAARLYSDIEAMRTRMRHIVRGPVFMSGSGPTLYCLVPNQRSGERLYNAFRGFTRDVHLCRFISL
ncbi:MAG: 4-(cytidine 5'-diphospho)-2-C-methyl-D-erythritol kinase [Alicyclobacillus sp.]|nr:4-(cytidine 5'-diphospho)-2-C-methyl-D-erythritol kinase [Alicyclobacillus sp.]